MHEALGGKVMSQGLRVGVEFGSAQQLLGAEVFIITTTSSPEGLPHAGAAQGAL